jgi:hypothetical protein
MPGRARRSTLPRRESISRGCWPDWQANRSNRPGVSAPELESADSISIDLAFFPGGYGKMVAYYDMFDE